MCRASMIVAVFSALAFGDSAAWADDAKSSSIDWSGFNDFHSIRGTVVKADDQSITIDQPKLVPVKTKGKNKKPKIKIGTERITINYAPQALVRQTKVPTVSDGKGGTVMASSKEVEAAMQPIGAPGYKAEKSDLKPGTIVLVELAYPSSMAVKDVKKSDLVVKYARIEGQAKTPATKSKQTPANSN